MTDLSVDQLLSLPYWSWVKYSPWKIHDDYCDSQGRCWFRKETNQLWFLARPDDDVYSVIACLPHYALPLPSKKVEQ